MEVLIVCVFQLTVQRGMFSLKCLSYSYKYYDGHYNDVIMDAIASQITSLTIVYSTVYSDADQRKHQSFASLAFVRGSHRGPVNSPHKWPITRKMCQFDDVIMWRWNTAKIQGYIFFCYVSYFLADQWLCVISWCYTLCAYTFNRCSMCYDRGWISIRGVNFQIHDDVIKWRHFPRYWPFVRGIHRSPVNSPHKGQWREALMFFWSAAE